MKYTITSIYKIKEHEIIDRGSLLDDKVDILEPPFIGESFSFFDNNKGRVIHTSRVDESIEDGDKLIVTTQNTIYTFEKSEVEP